MSCGIGSLASYDNLEQVGEGTYGYVYRARDKRTGETVALKRLIIHKENSGFSLCAVREIKFLKSLQHNNIVKLKDIATSKGCENLDTVITPDPSKLAAAVAAGERNLCNRNCYHITCFYSLFASLKIIFYNDKYENIYESVWNIEESM